MLEKVKKYWESRTQKQKHTVKGIMLSSIVLVLITLVVLARRDNMNITLYEEEEQGLFEMEESDNVKDLWHYTNENKLAKTKENVDSLKKENLSLKEEIARIKEDFKDREEAQEQKYKSLISEEIAALREELKKPTVKKRVSKEKKAEPEFKVNEQFQGSDPFNRRGRRVANNNISSPSSNNKPVERSPGIEVFTMPGLTSSCIEEECVSAGSYASAKLLTTGDVETSLNSTSDPQPMLFRVTSKARGALKHGSEEYRETDIIGCVVIGSAEGKINTEKAYVRLVKMTCENDSGESITQNIEGYVTKASSLGIRGRVIDGTNGLIKNAMIANLTGQFGAATSQKFNPQLNFQGGFSSTTNQTAGEYLKGGLGKSIESSGNMIAEYYMKKAEQYSPVIEISPGQEVEIVFMSEYRFDGSGVSVNREEEDNNSVGRL